MTEKTIVENYRKAKRAFDQMVVKKAREADDFYDKRVAGDDVAGYEGGLWTQEDAREKIIAELEKQYGKI